MATSKNRKRAGVSTNVYLRKKIIKNHNERSANFKNKGSGVVYAWEMY